MMVLSRAPLQVTLVGTSGGDNLTAAIHEHVYSISQEPDHLVDVPKPWMNNLFGLGIFDAMRLNKAIVEATHAFKHAGQGNLCRLANSPAAVFGGVWASIDNEHRFVQTKSLTHHLMMFRTWLDVSHPLRIAGQFHQQEGHALARTVESAKHAIFENDWARLGKMVEQGLKIEAKMGGIKMGQEANDMLIKARLAGALGGTFNHDVMVLVVPPSARDSVASALGYDANSIDCRIENEGARLVYSV